MSNVFSAGHENISGEFSYLLAFNDDFYLFLQFFHEATALNLLETLLYHKVRSLAISSVCIDLVKFFYLISGKADDF